MVKGSTALYRITGWVHTWQAGKRHKRFTFAGAVTSAECSLDRPSFGPRDLARRTRWTPDLPHVHPPESHVESIIEELPGTTVCRHMRHVYHIRLGVNLAVGFRRSPDFMSFYTNDGIIYYEKGRMCWQQKQSCVIDQIAPCDRSTPIVTKKVSPSSRCPLLSVSSQMLRAPK